MKVNGVEVNLDAFEGHSNEDLTRAYRRHRVNHGVSDGGSFATLQGSGSRFIGTPRLRKHKRERVEGVRLK